MSAYTHSSPCRGEVRWGAAKGFCPSFIFVVKATGLPLSAPTPALPLMGREKAQAA